MTDDLFCCWRFHVRGHVYTYIPMQTHQSSQSYGAMLNSELKHRRLQRLEPSASVRQPLLKLNEETLYDVVIVIKKLANHREAEQVRSKQQQQEALGQKL
jgi:hypothetical protein